MRLALLLHRPGACLALAALLAPAAQAAPAPPAGSGVEMLARHLEAAVSRVSPSAQAMTGNPDATQALHMTGFGVVVVLPPRALPQKRPPLSVRARARAQQEREPEPSAPSAPPRIVALPASPAPRALEQLQRELEREMALRAQLIRAMERARAGDDALLRRALELEMLAIRDQAELFSIEVERARQRTEREVRARLGGASAEAAAAPGAPAQERPSEPATPPAPAGPAEPPWNVWIGPSAELVQANQAFVQQVRDAVIGGLEAHGSALQGLAPAESVTVAVDFVGAGPFALRPRVRTTLVVRTSVADLLARAAGTLGPAEFRQRVQARQY